MRALKVVIVIMGVLIVAGTVVIAVTIANRMGNRAPPPLAGLGEPAGSRIVGIAAAGERLAVHVTGGGAEDRIVIVDPTTHRVIGRLVPVSP